MVPTSMTLNNFEIKNQRGFGDFFAFLGSKAHLKSASLPKLLEIPSTKTTCIRN